MDFGTGMTTGLFAGVRFVDRGTGAAKLRVLKKSLNSCFAVMVDADEPLPVEAETLEASDVDEALPDTPGDGSAGEELSPPALLSAGRSDTVAESVGSE